MNTAQSTQTYVILGWGGQTVGLADIVSDGHQTTITASTPFIPPQGKTFEAWLVDGKPMPIGSETGPSISHYTIIYHSTQAKENISK